nr:unnamed protein product [Callosobruchus chinensis]
MAHSEDTRNIVLGPELERNIDVSLGQLMLPLLKAHDEQVVQVDGETNEPLTALKLLKRAIKLAKWYEKQGLGIGDSISINSENRNLVLFGRETRSHPKVIMFDQLIGDVDSEEVDEEFEATPLDIVNTVATYCVLQVDSTSTGITVLLKHPMAKQYDLSCIKEMRSGAAPLGAELEKELKEKFNVEHVSQGYGMTETTLAVLATPHGKAKSGSCGVVVPGMMAKVIDDDGKALGKYQEGELCFKGPLIMKGNTIDPDGWLHTGDVAYYDADGYFFIVDRIKELIKYKAFQVAPAELEALLLTHNSIEDAAVVGLPDEMAGELPLAFVVKKPGAKLTEREVEKFIEDNVSPQKRLRGGVVFTNEIPKNPTGKILRRVLREKAKNMKSKL